MIKYLLIIFLSLGTGSTQAQKSKKAKNYENDVFSIVIPNGWKKYQDIPKEETVIFQMAPKGEIQEEVYIQSSGNIVIDLKKAPEQAARGSMSYTKFDISEESLRHVNLEAYVQQRVSRFAKRERKYEGESQTVYKKSDDHFIEILKFRTIGSEILMYHLMHFKSRDGKLYMIIFSSPEEKLPKYINDAKVAFASFRFL
jgi:hypothetical protein